MNRPISIILLFLYLIALIRPIMPYIEYSINKDYIAKVLCINKNNPKSGCNGKCYLKKQLKKVYKTNASDKQTLPPKIELEKYPIDFIQEKTYSNEQFKDVQNVLFLYYFFKIKINSLDVPSPPPKLC